MPHTTRSFIHDLDRLISTHLASARWANDFLDPLDALHDAANRLAERADRYRFKDETDAEWRERKNQLDTPPMAPT